MKPLALHTLDAFEESLRTHPRVMLFKHSPVCPVSSRAHVEWEAFLDVRPEAPTLFVDVIADRPVARGLAEACGIPHASPQAILFVQGRPVWHRSHEDVTKDNLEAAWLECGAQPDGLES